MLFVKREVITAIIERSIHGGWIIVDRASHCVLLLNAFLYSEARSKSALASHRRLNGCTIDAGCALRDGVEAPHCVRHPTRS